MRKKQQRKTVKSGGIEKKALKVTNVSEVSLEFAAGRLEARIAELEKRMNCLEDCLIGIGAEPI